MCPRSCQPVLRAGLCPHCCAFLAAHLSEGDFPCLRNVDSHGAQLMKAGRTPVGAQLSARLGCAPDPHPLPGRAGRGAGGTCRVPPLPDHLLGGQGVRVTRSSLRAGCWGEAISGWMGRVPGLASNKKQRLRKEGRFRKTVAGGEDSRSRKEDVSVSEARQKASEARGERCGEGAEQVAWRPASSLRSGIPGSVQGR